MSLLSQTIPWLLVCSFVPSCFVDADHNLGEAKWTPAYDLLEEHEIRKDNLLTMLPIMTKEWRVCFDIKPLQYNHTGWANVLHLTIGGNLGEYGDNILKVGFNRKLGVAIRSAVNGIPITSNTSKKNCHPLVFGQDLKSSKRRKIRGICSL